MARHPWRCHGTVACLAAVTAAGLVPAAVWAQESPGGANEAAVETPAAKPLPAVIERYEQLLLSSPGPGTAFDKVYQHFLENDGLDVLETRWAEQAKEPGQAWAATLVRGLLAQRRGRDEQARAAYQKLVELKPEDYRGWVMLADDRFGRGEFEQAAEAMQTAAQLEVPVAAKLELYQKLARMQERAFDDEASLETYRALAREFPEDPFALEEAGQALLRAEEFDEAKAIYDRLLELAAEDPYRRVTVTMRLAEIDERQDRFDDAIARYEAMLGDTSETSWMHRELRRLIEDIYRRQDDLAGLIDYYQKRLAEHPQDLAATVKLSDVFFELNRKQEGLAALEKAVGMAPDRTDLQGQLARRYLELEQFVTAVDVLKKLADRRPDDARYAEQLGSAYWQLFRTEEKPEWKEKALAAWKRMVPENNDQPRLALYQAETFQNHGLEEEAVVAYRAAVDLDPGNAETRERLAVLLWKLERDDEADQTLRGLVEAENKVPENYQRLAKIYRRHDQPERALQAVNDGLALEADHFDLLAFKWALLADQERWEDTLALYQPLLASAPNDYFVHEIENRQIQALSNLNQLDAFREQALAELAANQEMKEERLRLLLRACLQLRALDDAEAVLRAARQRFSKSVPLVRLEAEFYRRTGQQDMRVAALQRLTSLQPNREADWLREIAHAYRDAGNWDQALETAQSLISRLPASPDGYLLFADLAFAADRPDEAVAKLRQAIQHSDQPNDVRMRLARFYSGLGKNQEALDVYEEAFEAEEDPAGKISLVKPLTEIYFNLGRADELVEKFKHRQLAEQAGARYALYLAAIYTQMQDYSNARKELSRALANRQKDPQLLIQLIRLAEAEGNANELLRFQRMLTDLEPSVRNKADLAQAMVTNGETDEALRLVEANRAELLENPSALQALVDHANDPAFAAELAKLFADSLRQRPNDWQGRLLLGDLYLAEGQTARAEQVYWELMRMDPPLEELAAEEPADPLLAGPAVPALTTIAQIYTSPLAQRLQRTPQLRQQATPKIMGRSMHRFARGNASLPLVGTGQTIELEEARDTALVYLALLAMNNNREAAFLEQLKLALEERKAGFGERLLTYAIIESPSRLLDAVDRYLEHPKERTESADQFCTMLLMSYSGRNQQEDVAERVADYLDRLYQRLEEAATGLSIDVAISRFELLRRMGKHDEADQVAFEALRLFDSQDPVQVRSAYNLALRSNQLVRAEDLLTRMLNEGGAGQFRHQTVHMAFGLVRRLYQDPVLRERALELTERLLGDIYQFQTPTGPGAMGMIVPRVNVLSAPARNAQRLPVRYSGARGRVQPLHYQQGAPGTNDFIGQMQLNWFGQIFSEMRDAKNQEALFAILDRQIKDYPDDQKIYPRLALAYAQWAFDGKEESLAGFRAVRKATGDPSLRLNEAAVLFALKRYAEAKEQLKAVPEEAGDLYVDAQFWLLNVAKATKDQALGRQVAKRLGKLNLPLHLRMALAQELNQLKLTEEAKEINRAAHNQRRRNPPRYTAVQRMERELNKLNKPDQMDKAVLMARRILAQNPMAANQRQARGARNSALRKLKQAGELEGYIEELTALAEKSPNSPRFELLLGEAKTETDKDAALLHLQRACQMRPRDIALHLKVADLLGSQERDTELRELYEHLLGIDPVAVLQQRSSQIIKAYKEAGEMDRLVKKSRGFPNYGRLPNMHSPLQGFYQSLGRTLKGEDELDLAVEVWKLGLQHARQPNLSQCQLIVDALLEEGRELDAALFLEEFLLNEPNKPQELFVLSSGVGANRIQNFFEQIHYSGQRVNSPLLDMVLSIRDPAAAKRLHACIRVQSELHPDNWHVQAMDAMLQLHRAEPGAEARLEKLLGEDLAANKAIQDHHKVSVLRLFAGKLLEQEGREPMGLEALRQASQYADRQKTNFPNRINIRLELVRAAQETGKDPLARQALNEVLEVFGEQSAAGQNNFEFEQLMLVAERMIGYGEMEQAGKAIALAEGLSNYGNHSGYQRRVGELKSEIALLRGDLKQPACYAWVAAVDDEGVATVQYEITSPLPEESSSQYAGSQQMMVRGRDFDKLSGKYQLKLMVGADPNAMTEIARLNRAAARGQWRGKLPVERGFLRTVLDTGKSVFFGDPVPLLPAKNLLSNPRFEVDAETRELTGWKAPGTLSYKTVEESPGKGGTSLSLSTGTQREITLVGERIEAEPNTEYALAGWMWVDAYSGDYARLGLRCLNEEGKQIAEYWARHDRSNMGRKWTRLWQVYHLNKRTLNGSRSLPKETAFIQPVVRIRGGCRLADFSLGVYNQHPATD
ncbi:MAG: tetratricopeptide repeat protein [Verrucomicrobiota bacterium]